MSAPLDDPERRLIPRWRDSLTTIASGELVAADSSSERPAFDEGDDRFFPDKVADWRENQTPAFAADLVASAVVMQKESEATDAAEFVLAHPREVSSSARKLARQVLGMETAGYQVSDESEISSHVADNPSSEETVDIERTAIRRLRKHLRDQPRNVLLWVDIARRYTTLGYDAQARRAINAAVSLAPDNRFTLRSAARFFVHQNEADHAHRLLRRSEATRRDPWLLSAEIAVADVAGKTSGLIKSARSMLKAGRLPASQVTELAGSLASLELGAGKMREARRLFAEALIQPNDNAVAQVEWASRRASEIKVDAEVLNTPRSYEARAWESFTTYNWKAALGEAQRWFDDEPFSGRPIALGTHVASVALEDYDSAIRLARRWLLVNPTDQLILNNLAFSLASTGQLEEADRLQARRDLSSATEVVKIAWTATDGLIHFRHGRIEAGRVDYERAIEMARVARMQGLRAMATAFWAREEVVANTPRSALILAEARKAEKESTDSESSPSLRLLMNRVTKMLSEKS
ncbi:MAG: hypothetical protein HOQ19_08315 [Gemmatimonadaceae bacterium]|nr:hypothetical protein [Gemmatimonadaceae bacterium]